jgi:hypothetical protein
MKTNIFLLIVILSIPFALSSQTRKAIPAGRYEALSGIKISHSVRNQEANAQVHDSNKQIWEDLEKYFANEKGDILYVNLSSREFGLKLQNFHEVKNIDQEFDLLLSTNLQRDKEISKHLRGKKIVALFDRQPLEKVISKLGKYEIISYRADKSMNVYLLRTK